MSKLEIIAGTDTLDLSDKLTYLHLGNSGFGMPEVSRVTQQGAFQEGVTDLGYNIGGKTITLTLLINGTDKANYRYIRQLTAMFFRPRKTALTLRFTDDLLQVYEIGVHYLKGLEYDSSDRHAFMQKIAIVLFAPNPFWYNPTQQVFVYGVGGAAGNFSFPITFPVTFGVSTLNQDKIIEYNGSWKAYPTITINGPIVNPVITNTSTDEKLDFTGLTLNSGESIVINTDYGYKTVTKNDGSNLISSLSTDSDLATFHIASDDEVIDARNNINVTGSGINSSTEIYIRYYENFIAI